MAEYLAEPMAGRRDADGPAMIGAIRRAVRGPTSGCGAFPGG
jgi:hypothetical protein